MLSKTHGGMYLLNMVFIKSSTELVHIYIQNGCSECSDTSALLTTKFFKFLLCAGTFVKSGGSKDRLVVEVPPRLPTLWFVQGKTHSLAF